MANDNNDNKKVASMMFVCNQEISKTGSCPNSKSPTITIIATEKYILRQQQQKPQHDWRLGKNATKKKTKTRKKVNLNIFQHMK